MSTNNQDAIRRILHNPFIKKASFFLGITASVALGFMVYQSTQEPVYRPLDYAANEKSLPALIDVLEKAGIDYKIRDSDNTVMIPAKDMEQARIKLLSANLPHDDSEFNFSYLNEKSGFGNTQFLENARYILALEHDLSKTISAIQGVQAAKVHIAVVPNNIFSDENSKTTASVVLTLSSGFGLEKEKIRAITQIVSSSVADLDPNNVSVTDQYGHLLSNSLDQNSVFNSEQLTFQKNVQSYYEKRIESMIASMLGENKVHVRVYANVDFTQHETAKEQYTPEEKIVRSEQSVTDQGAPSGASGVPGSLTGKPPGEGDEQSGSSSGSQGSSSHSESIKNYEVGKSVSYTKSNFAKIANLSVAVVVDNESKVDPNSKKSITQPINADKINKITELVKTTIGFDDKRGDKVTVVNSSFANLIKEEPVKPSNFWTEPWFWDWVKKSIGIIGGLLAFFVISRQVLKAMKASTGSQANMLVPASGNDESMVVTQEMLRLKQQQLDYLKDLSSKEPAKVTNIIRNWLGKQSNG